MLEERSYCLEVGPGICTCEEEDASEVQPGGNHRAVAHHSEEQAGGGVHDGRIKGEEEDGSSPQGSHLKKQCEEAGSRVLLALG